MGKNFKRTFITIGRSPMVIFILPAFLRRVVIYFFFEKTVSVSARIEVFSPEKFLWQKF